MLKTIYLNDAKFHTALARQSAKVIDVTSSYSAIGAHASKARAPRACFTRLLYDTAAFTETERGAGRRKQRASSGYTVYGYSVDRATSTGPAACFPRPSPGAVLTSARAP